MPRASCSAAAEHEHWAAVVLCSIFKRTWIRLFFRHISAVRAHVRRAQPSRAGRVQYDRFTPPRHATTRGRDRRGVANDSQSRHDLANRAARARTDTGRHGCTCPRQRSDSGHGPSAPHPSSRLPSAGPRPARGVPPCCSWAPPCSAHFRSQRALCSQLCSGATRRRSWPCTRCRHAAIAKGEHAMIRSPSRHPRQHAAAVPMPSRDAAGSRQRWLQREARRPRRLHRALYCCCCAPLGFLHRHRPRCAPQAKVCWCLLRQCWAS